MPADHDDRIDDEVLQRVVSELRLPVRLDPAVDARALDRIRADSAGRPAFSSGHRWGGWIAGAAIAAGLLLAVILRQPGELAQPAQLAGSSSAETPAGSGEARPVYLRLDAPASSRVAVVGDFNDWDPSATPLRPTGTAGTWIVELRLKPGRYHYSFLIDGRRWERDPREAPAAESDFGAPVSVLTVI
jgi:hypothetical protein